MHIAIVLGKGQKFVGIVTLEDLMEELVGEIHDEYDTDAERRPRRLSLWAWYRRHRALLCQLADAETCG